MHLVAAVFAAFTLALGITIGPSVYRDWSAAFDEARAPRSGAGQPAEVAAPKGDRAEDPVDRLLALREAATEGSNGVARATDELARELKATQADRERTAAEAETVLRERDGAELAALPPVPSSAGTPIGVAPLPAPNPEAVVAPRAADAQVAAPPSQGAEPAPSPPVAPEPPQSAPQVPEEVPASAPEALASGSEPQSEDAVPAAPAVLDAASTPTPTEAEVSPAPLAADVSPAPLTAPTPPAPAFVEVPQAQRLPQQPVPGGVPILSDLPAPATSLVLRAPVVVYWSTAGGDGESRAAQVARALREKGWTTETRSVPEPIASGSVAYASDLERADAERIQAALGELATDAAAPSGDRWPLGRALSSDSGAVEVWLPSSPGDQPDTLSTPAAPLAPRGTSEAVRAQPPARPRSRLPVPTPRPEFAAPPQEPAATREAAPKPRPRPPSGAREREAAPPPRTRQAQPARPERSREQARREPPKVAPEPPPIQARPEPPRIQARPEPRPTPPAAPRVQAPPQPRRPEPRIEAAPGRPRAVVRSEPRVAPDTPTGSVAPVLPPELRPTAPGTGLFR